MAIQSGTNELVKYDRDESQPPILVWHVQLLARLENHHLERSVQKADQIVNTLTDRVNLCIIILTKTC